MDKTREFENRFADFDNSKFVYDFQSDTLKPDIESLLLENVQMLMRKLETELETNADYHDTSVYTGMSGIVLLYMHLMDVKKFDGRNDGLQAALSHMQHILPRLSKKRYTFLCGDCGPLAIGAVLYHQAHMVKECKDLVKKVHGFLMHVTAFEASEPNELLYGRVGYLYSLLFLRKHIGASEIEAETVRQVISAILQAGQSHSAKLKHKAPLYYEWHKKAYVGSAHGFSGILYILLQAKEFLSEEELNRYIKPSIDYVLSLKFSSGNYPSSLGNSSDKLLHWCHGAPGVVHLMLLAYQVFGDMKYMESARVCGEVIWNKGLLRKGYGLCHGVAGNGYALLRLFQVTREERYLYRAVKFAEWCYDYGKHNCRVPDRPLSLFEGLAGTIYFLSDLLDPLHSAFPAFQLI